MKKWKKIILMALGIGSVCLIPAVGITSCTSSSQATTLNSNKADNPVKQTNDKPK